MPSPPVSAGLFSSGTAFTLTARDGVTPTSRTGFENVSGSPRPQARSVHPPVLRRRGRLRVPPPRCPLAGSWGASGVPGGRGPPGRKKAAAPAARSRCRSWLWCPAGFPPFWRDDFSRVVFPNRLSSECTRSYYNLGCMCVCVGGGSFFRSPF